MKNLKSSKEQIEEKDYELEDILSASCVHEEMFENQQVETIKWRNLCEELELALRMTATPENLVHTVHPRCYCSPCIQKEVLAKYEAMKKGE